MVASLIGRTIETTVDVAPDLPRVHADPTMIEQVVMNLLINARDAIDERGDGPRRIHVSATLAPAPAGGRAAVVLAVADTGIGMDEATRARIFEPFFTTKPEGQGTGLGLATVYGVVRQHGASLEVTSEPGVGTTFRIGWPVEADASPGAPASA
jgi:signal transduction histidine kinase